jgi:2-dehydropantoate 2-reductase
MSTVCIVGAGSIGGVIGTRLAATGVPVSALARGRTLESLRANGWRVRSGGELVTAPVAAAGSASELGVHDVVMLTVKAHALPALAPGLTPLLGPGTVVVAALNGVPWWFFDGLGGRYDGLRLTAVDPDGAIAAAIPTRRVIGCVVHMSASTPEPGLSDHRAGDGLILGSPLGADVEPIAGLLGKAGFAVTLSPRVQKDIWYKLWGNMTMNPVSALTGATGDRMLDDVLVRNFCSAAMREASAIGARIGCVIDQDPEARHAVTRELGAFKTSMLVDAERGKPIELDALVTAVHELGQRTGVATPFIDGLLGITRLFAQTRGLLSG